MPQLRPSIAGHLLRSGLPASKSYGPAAARFIGQTAPKADAEGKSKPETSVASYLNKEDTSVKHDKLDYGAAVDGATSCVDNFGRSTTILLTISGHTHQSLEES